MFAMLFPKIADNNYLGSRLVVYIFIPFLLLMTWRSIIHLFYAEFGLHGIANMIVIDGSPDPMPVIYAFFSLWGLIQLLFCAFAWVILFRYKSLLPLTILVFLIEWSARVINASNSPLNLAEYKTGTTPGIESASYVTVFLLILFITSLLNRKS